MVKLIVGLKGTGKTKRLLSIANESAIKSPGHVIFITNSSELTYQIDHTIRLIDIKNYQISSIDEFLGFISGLLSGNYDITEIYIDSILKICNCCPNDITLIISRLKHLINNNINIIITVSSDKLNIPPEIQEYII